MGRRGRLYLRFIAVVVLLSVLQVQVFGASRPPNSSKRWDSLPQSRVTPESRGAVIHDAEKLLHLPTWSQAYRSCRENTEISCEKLVRASQVVREYVKKLNAGKLNGYVRVRVTSSDPVHCQMSSFYNAFLISLLTNRNLILEADGVDVSWLRPEHLYRFRSARPISAAGQVLATNYTFACDDVFTESELIEISGCMWPQIAYIHQDLGEKLRNVFGTHAAYYIGNYLFNVDDGGCSDVPNGAIGIVGVTGSPGSLVAQTVIERSQACRSLSDAVVIINVTETDSASAIMSKMRQMMCTKKLVYPFSAKIPWYAMAMQGVKGVGVDLYGQSCITLRSSQSGSIVHTYNPNKRFHYAVNNDFFVCGLNFEAARLFLHDLLW